MTQDPRYILNEDFEAGVVESPYWSPAPATISTNANLNSKAAVFPASGVAAGVLSTARTLGIPQVTSGKVSVEFDFLYSAAQATADVRVFRLQTSNGNNLLTIDFRDTAIWYTTGLLAVTASVTSAYTLITKGHLKVVLDLDKARYSLYINGELKASDLSFYIATGQRTVDRIYFANKGGQPNLLIDNLYYYVGDTNPAEIVNPIAPVLTAGVVTYDSVPLTWEFTPPAGLVYYEIYRNDVLLEAIVGSLDYTDYEVASETSYQYKVIAKDSNGAVLADTSNIVSVTTPAAPAGTVLTPNTTPPVLSVLGVSDSTVSLGWSYTPTAGYQIYYDIFRNDVLVGQDVTTKLFTDRVLSASTQYTYRVEVKDINGLVVASNTVTATTNEAPPVDPVITPNTTPPTLSVTSIAYNRVNLAWTYTPTPDYPIYYEILRDGVVVGQTATIENFSDYTVSPSTSYTYKVQVKDLNGLVTESATAGATTAAAPTNTGGDTGGSTGGDTGGSTGGDTGGSTESQFMIDGVKVLPPNLGNVYQWNRVTRSYNNANADYKDFPIAQKDKFLWEYKYITVADMQVIENIIKTKLNTGVNSFEVTSWTPDRGFVTKTCYLGTPIEYNVLVASNGVPIVMQVNYHWIQIPGQKAL